MANPETTGPLWDDVCWDMIMRCEPVADGFKPPSVELVAEFVRDYPQWAEDLIDFAATCRTMDFWAAKYPAPEPTQQELDAAVKRAMKVFRAACRRRRRKELANG